MNVADGKLVEAAYEAISETFETMAFMGLVPREEDLSTEEKSLPWMWARVAVDQPLTGAFLLLCPQSLAQEATASLFGAAEDSLTRQQTFDALGEMVNILAGRCLSLLVSREETFSLGLPETGTGWPEQAQGALLTFVTDEEQPVALYIDLQGRE